MKRTVLAALSGAVLACALILSCSDDSPSDADAQVACDCPAAEAPLAGRIVRVTETDAVPAEGFAAVTARCAPDAILLGGSCGLDQANNVITLNEARANPTSEAFICVWNNPTMIANTGIAIAICLTPPPAS